MVVVKTMNAPTLKCYDGMKYLQIQSIERVVLDLQILLFSIKKFNVEG